ncbi:hypothetical protein ACS0TY_034622 [Phlomoides rotata]
MSTLHPIFFFIIIIILTATNQRRGAAALLRNDPDSIRRASSDYGNIVHDIPSGVLYPSSVEDILHFIRSLNDTSTTVAARGHGHSVRGQAEACGGVVVEMAALSGKGSRIRVSREGLYADVGGEQLWIDVLKETLKEGVYPVSWTDYLYLSVGGTLSNAGISGQAFLHGPQISNVIELDVITGTGEYISCSRNRNPELFFGVLGGLGQFGIITRARIILDKAPTRVKWVRLVYTNFSTFTRDQEYLISSKAPNYVEGLLIVNENETNTWRSDFSSPSNQSHIASLLKNQGILYAIELVKYYDNQTATTIDEEFKMLVEELNFNEGLIFSRDASLLDFLNRVGDLDNSNGPLQSHPWLNLFIPKSGIYDFNAGVLATMLPRLNHTSDVFIFYPFNRNKWDDGMSAVTPNEDVFYTLGLLHTSHPDEYSIYDQFNNEILEFCQNKGIKVKQYLPNYSSKQDWIKHYGSKWGAILQKKAKFDPKRRLSPGQRIFNSV